MPSTQLFALTEQHCTKRANTITYNKSTKYTKTEMHTEQVDETHLEVDPEIPPHGLGRCAHKQHPIKNHYTDKSNRNQTIAEKGYHRDLTLGRVGRLRRVLALRKDATARRQINNGTNHERINVPERRELRTNHGGGGGGAGGGEGKVSSGSVERRRRRRSSLSLSLSAQKKQWLGGGGGLRGG